jgi:hypothetical protein
MSGESLRTAKRRLCRKHTINLPGHEPIALDLTTDELFNPLPTPSPFTVQKSSKVSKRATNLVTFLLNTMEANEFAHSVAAERNAQRLLRHHLSKKQYEAYIISGMFWEVSDTMRLYIFRKGFPTILCTMASEDPMAITPVAALCAHAVSYTANSFAGGLCPTDDVLNNVLHMRTDEEAFLKDCNWHSFEKPMSGL